MLLLLIVINILSYVDRHMLPAFASQITADLELTRHAPLATVLPGAEVIAS